uniref:Uncharacterized protein n=1 Tax=Anguilla anguilla TaxID=7936 RepID=A0A0E9WZB2_ANGAN
MSIVQFSAINCAVATTTLRPCEHSKVTTILFLNPCGMNNSISLCLLCLGK